MADPNYHRSFTLLLNDNKGAYTAGQINAGFNSSGTNFYRLCAVDNRIQTLDINYWINKHISTHASFDSNFTNAFNNLVQTGTTDENISSWINAKNIVKNNITFIWGSLEKGGLGIAYSNANKSLRFYSISGKYTNGTKIIYYGTANPSSVDPAYYDSMRYIIVGYLYYGTLQAPNVDNGTYYNKLTILYNRRRSASNYQIESYDLKYTGDINQTVNYDAVNPSRFNNVGEVNWTNTWTKHSILSNDVQYWVGVRGDDVFTNGVETAIYDDVNYPPDGYVNVNGHWYGDGVEPDENDNGGINPPQGGGGNYPKTNTPVPPTAPTQFTNDAFGTGFISVYNPTKQELLSFAQFLFAGITKNISAMLKKLVANPMDYVVGLNMCHFNVTSTSATSVKFGGVDTNVVMNVVDGQYKIMDGGDVYVPEASNTYLDYAPNTKVKIFIPYCGVHELPTDLIMGGTLHIRYIVDTLTGALVAELTLVRSRTWLEGVENGIDVANYPNGGLMWTYSGNCFTPIPIASTDYRNVVNGTLGLISGIGTTVATGNPLPAMGAIANSAINSKPVINVGGSIGSNYGYMTAQKAYLIISSPVNSKPLEYQARIGYPVNGLYYIGDCSGLTIVDTGTFNTGQVSNRFGVITDTEADELKQLLEGGIFV